MRRSSGRCCALAITAALSVACAPAAARRTESARAPAPDGPEDQPEERRVELLGGHVTIAVPASWFGEVEDARVAGAVIESRVSLEASGDSIGPPRFQLTVMELHVRTSGDVLADAREVFADEWILDPRAEPSGRVAWVLGDARPWNGQAPFTVLGALVVHEDGLLLRVMFRVAADVPVSARPDYAQRARAIVTGMQTGASISTSGGSHRLGDRLTIRVPDGYRFTCEETAAGLAFCGVRHVRPIGGRSHGMASLRLVPASQLPLPPPSGATQVEETLLGRPMPWSSSRGDSLLLRTSVAIDADTRLEVLVDAPDEEGQRALLSIVRSLSLVD